MTPEAQSEMDRNKITIHTVVNGWIVGYPNGRRVYLDMPKMFKDIELALNKKDLVMKDSPASPERGS